MFFSPQQLLTTPEFSLSKIRSPDKEIVNPFRFPFERKITLGIKFLNSARSIFLAKFATVNRHLPITVHRGEDSLSPD